MDIFKREVAGEWRSKRRWGALEGLVGYPVVSLASPKTSLWNHGRGWEREEMEKPGPLRRGETQGQGSITREEKRGVQGGDISPVRRESTVRLETRAQPVVTAECSLPGNWS